MRSSSKSDPAFFGLILGFIGLEWFSDYLKMHLCLPLTKGITISAIAFWKGFTSTSLILNQWLACIQIQFSDVLNVLLHWC